MRHQARIAIAGATSDVGIAILKALLVDDFHVTILFRKGSDVRGLAKSGGLTFTEVNYTDSDTLVRALENVSVLICTVGNRGLGIQFPLIDAAVVAGVERYIPSEFGADPEHDKNIGLPFYAPKLRVLDYLKRKAADNPGFSYTRITTHAFLDWGIREKFLADPYAHKITIYNGGNTPFSVTTLSTIAKSVIAVIQNLDKTKNRPVFVHDAAITQNDLVRYAKAADGIEWDIKQDTTKELLDRSYRELAKENPDVDRAMTGFTFVAVYDDTHEPDLTSRLDNKLLGIPTMRRGEIAEIIKTTMADVLKLKIVQ